MILRVGEVVEQVRSKQRRASGAMCSPRTTRTNRFSTEAQKPIRRRGEGRRNGESLG